TSERQEMDLLRVLAILRIAGGGLLLDVQTPIRQERQGPAVGGEAGVRVVPGSEREAARFAAGRVDRPDRVSIAVLPRCDGLERECDQVAVGREARVGGDAEPVQVVGAEGPSGGALRGSGHGSAASGRARVVGRGWSTQRGWGRNGRRGTGPRAARGSRPV